MTPGFAWAVMGVGVGLAIGYYGGWSDAMTVNESERRQRIINETVNELKQFEPMSATDSNSYELFIRQTENPLEAR